MAKQKEKLSGAKKNISIAVTFSNRSPDNSSFLLTSTLWTFIHDHIISYLGHIDHIERGAIVSFLPRE